MTDEQTNHCFFQGNETRKKAMLKAKQIQMNKRNKAVRGNERVKDGPGRDNKIGKENAEGIPDFIHEVSADMNHDIKDTSEEYVPEGAQEDAAIVQEDIGERTNVDKQTEHFQNIDAATVQEDFGERTNVDKQIEHFQNIIDEKANREKKCKEDIDRSAYKKHETKE
eukprot:8440027-Heterocapsa_arctica.AAC.1